MHLRAVANGVSTFGFDSRSAGAPDGDKLNEEHDSGNSDGSSSLDSEESFSEV